MMVWLSGVGVIPQTKGFLVWFMVRVNACVVGWWGANPCFSSTSSFSLSFSLSRSLSLKINKYNFKIKKDNVRFQNIFLGDVWKSYQKSEGDRELNDVTKSDY